MPDRSLPEKIAIVSLGCVFPDAPNPETFWKNILAKKVSIKPMTSHHFDRGAHFRPEMFGKVEKHDKSYTDLGAEIDSLDFNGLKYRLPPKVVDHMDDNQKIILMSTDQALQSLDLSGWNREKVSVFVGSSMTGPKHHDFQRRAHFDRFKHGVETHTEFLKLPQAPREKVLDDVEAVMKRDTFMVTEDSAPGILPNITAARVASVFDFHGHTYMVDAACASSLAAVIIGVQQLISGESDVVIAGGADMLDAEIGRIYFSGINALSPDGSFPFDERANGFVIGQGGGVVVLKRLSDALRDGDPIWATIAGYGQTSDGKGKSIAAPNSKWQAKTIENALRMCGYPADSVELIEAHGTSTRVGDKSEIEALKISFDALGVQQKNFCAVGSVKSNIGHLKSAAGIAGLIKALFAIKHQVLPPSANCVKINPELKIDHSPFFINTESQPWKAQAHPRRAGVSAFGFGGANYHIALEEFRAGDQFFPAEKKEAFLSSDLQRQSALPVESSARPLPNDGDEHTLWLSAENLNVLTERLNSLLSQWNHDGVDLERLCEENYRACAQDACRLAFCFRSMQDLRDKAAFWLENQGDYKAQVLQAKGIFFRQSSPVSMDNVAFMFPGQGSQYPDMMLDMVSAYPSVNRIVRPMDLYWQQTAGARISDLLSSKQRGFAETESLLKNTRNTHPALLYSSLVAHQLLQDMGVRPKYMIGHSAGEITALAAAGKVSLTDALFLMERRSRSFVEMNVDDFGKMIAVRTDLKTLPDVIEASGCQVVLANLNSPRQLIVSGLSSEIDRFKGYLTEQKIQFVELKVSHAFHSPVVEQASLQFGQALKNVKFSKGESIVYANEFCDPYPSATKEIRALLQRQIVAPVHFMGTIEKLYAQGVRLFVEVGPNNVLSQLTGAILGERPHQIVSTNQKKLNDVNAWQRSLAALFVEGVTIHYIPPAKNQSANVAPQQTLSASGPKPGVVYSGVAVGLPGSYKKSFQDDNFDQLFAGNNLIERLTDREKQKLADLRVSKVEKTAQGPVFHLLDSLQDVIQLAGKIGQMDALADYGWDPKEVEQMNQAIQHGVAAGYEALRDAQIPLVRQYSTTASGGFLPDRWALPLSMQRRTGVIFAHSFPMVETVIAEVSRYVSFRFGHQVKQDIIAFYERILPQIKDAEAKKLLTDWFVMNYQRLSEIPSTDEVYRFNHQFIHQISSLANNRLAQYVQALGPNFQLNAACSSTSTAITLAEEMIQSGRVDRMLIIAGDDATSDLSLPYLGAGFLSTGAATCEADLYRAAVPFDRRRNGMIMSAGAVALVVEAREEALRRGIHPVCELLGSHVFNTGGHHARLDIPKYAEELRLFMDAMEKEHGFTCSDIASKLLYMSHETYTPARGGCSEAEAVALRHVFGQRFTEIEVTNTKGMTGHTMGTSIEDVVAARALQEGQMPPVVHFSEPDPKLAGLRLSRGGNHSCEYALRMAAGFGSQGNYLLLRKWTQTGTSRIADAQCYQKWLNEIAGYAEAQLEIEGRVLRVRDLHPGAVRIPRITLQESVSLTTENQPKNVVEKERISQQEVRVNASGMEDISHHVFAVISEVTGYPPEMLEADMEIESDLGIDTVKQATILSMLSERLGRREDVDFQLSAYPTVRHWMDLFGQGSSQSFSAKQPPSAAQIETASVQSSAFVDVSNHVFAVISEVTGYPPEMLEADMEIESDLGIDTVKQATILSMLSERLGRREDVDFQLSAYPTVRHWMDLFGQGSSQSFSARQPSSAAQIETTSVQSSAFVDVSNHVFAVISEVTGYPPEMLEADMEIESDLGIDTVKQATILSMLSERLGRREDVDFQLSAYPTVRHWMDLFGQGAESISAHSEKTEEEISDVSSDEENAFALQAQTLAWREAPAGNERRAWSEAHVCVWGGDVAYEVQDLWQKHCESVQVVDWNQQPSGDLGNVWLDLGLLNLSSAWQEPQQSLAELEAWAGRRLDWAQKYQQAGYPCPRQIFFLRSHTQNAWEALLQGYYQSLAKEWQCELKVLNQGEMPLADRLQQVQQEYEYPGLGVEIRYQDGKRWCRTVVNTDCLSVDEVSEQWTDEDVILITGGGNGITAYIARELSKKIPARMVLWGRTPWEEKDYTGSEWSETQQPLRRQELQKKLQQSGQRVTPVVLEKHWTQCLKQRELQQTLQIIQEHGCQVQYQVCDLTDWLAVQKGIQSIQKQWGPVTGIIHGAGYEKSQYLDKKTHEEWMQVVTPKVLGAINLYRFCDLSSVKLWVSMSSISGVFGNEAQTDYAAANAFLLGLSEEMSGQYPQMHSVSLVWSGWKDVGMAWRNSFVREHAQNMGMPLIPLAVGSQAAVQCMLQRKTPTTLILHGGLGHMLNAHWSGLNRMGPLLDRVEQKDEKTWRVFRTLSVEQDEWLHQHRLAGVPLAPGVGMLELLAEVHALFKPAKNHVCFDQVSFHDAFKLYRDEPREIFVEAEHLEKGSQKMRVFSEFKGRHSAMNQLRDYCAAIVSFTEKEPPEWNAQAWQLEGGMRLPFGEALSKFDSIPQNVIFGPLFNDFRRSHREEEDDMLHWNQRQMHATYRMPKEQRTNPKYQLDEYFMNFCLLDSMHQVGVAHGMLLTQKVHLPFKARQFNVFGRVDEEGVYQVYARLQQQGANELIYDIYLLDPHGQVCAYVLDSTYHRIQE